MIHDFKTSLKFSYLYDGDINAFYEELFPTLVNIEIITDKIRQKQGIDKILHFKSGKKIFIDEKKREKDYGDILLEEYSIWEEKVNGWLKDEKKTDYIVYIILPIKTIYFLPYLLVRNAFLENYSKWLENYGRVFAENKGYYTSNIPVIESELFKAINNQMKFKYQPKSNINIKELFK